MRCEIPAALDGERVDRVVAFLASLPRSDAAAVVESGGVRLAGKVVVKASQRVVSGTELDIDMPEAEPDPGAEPAVAFVVVHADADVVVVDKPAGLVVHPGAGNRDGTLVNGLLARFADMADEVWPDPTRPGVVHRLDKGTSGLLMVARRPAAMASLTAQLQAHTVERRYLALVWGSVAEPRGVVDAPVGRSASDPTRMAVRADGRTAVTGYEVVQRWSTPQPATLVRCTLQTGRTHQIRVHLAAIGHPVVGDDRYRGSAPSDRTVIAAAPPQRHRVSVAPGLAPRRPFLHAAVLGFDHPTTGERCRFESELPADLRRVLAALG